MARDPDTTSICFHFLFMLGSTSNLHFYDFHTSSHKMIYFLSNVYKWTLTLFTVESCLAVVVIYFTQSDGYGLWVMGVWKAETQNTKGGFPFIAETTRRQLLQ